MTDARNGTATTTYNAADLPYTVTTPAPGTGQPAQTTTTFCSSMLQATNVVQPDGTSLTNAYDAYFRRTTQAAINSANSWLLSSNSFSYDTASRLLTVTDGTNNVTYAYLANSPLVSTVTCKSNTTTRMTTTRQFDFLNRLQSISSSPSSSSSSSIAFG